MDSIISLPDDISGLDISQKIEFNCVECGALTVKTIRAYKRSKRCRKCAQKAAAITNKQTCLKRYGVENVFQLKEVIVKAQNTHEQNDPGFKNRTMKTKKTIQEKYGSDSFFASNDFKEKSKESKIKKYGEDYNYEIHKKVEITKIEKYGKKGFNNREKAKTTFLKKYGKENFIGTDDFKEKSNKTLIEKYGVDNIRKTEAAINKSRQTCLEKYGVDSYSKTEEFISKSHFKYTYDNLRFDSSWELAYYIYCQDNNMCIKRNSDSFEYIFNGIVHKYFPDFIVNGEYVEIKGLHFFENKDPNGKMVNPFDRSKDSLFEAKHQCAIRNNVNIIYDCSKYLQYVNNKYTKDYLSLFKNDLAFPYLNETLTDVSDMGLIHHFHKSIYEASVKGKPSPIEAWSDKNLIKQIAINRLKYVGRCKPSDILQGFNVTQKAKKVSVFKPSLAENIIKKYINEQSIFDPFSGFSGRLIGAMNCNKSYIGQDINESHVLESNQIIKYKSYKNCKVTVQDILSDNNKDLTNYCLFTCPPYGGKEHWNENNDKVEKSCDEWIDICLNKYKCEKYLFVVDKTEKYNDFIVETITNKSHFGYNNEYIINIRR